MLLLFCVQNPYSVNILKVRKYQANINWLGFRTSQTSKMEKNMIFPVGIYLLKFNNRNTRTKCGICSELKITTPKPERHPFWCLCCQFWTYCIPYSCVSTTNIKYVIAGWIRCLTRVWISVCTCSQSKRKLLN